MAGGEGERLRPLTVHLPKPLSPLLGEPAMGYAIRLLKRHHVRDIGVTLWYQPQKIRSAFGKGREYQVKLKYYDEKEPMGTAGSIKMAKKELDQTFFVLSGDGLTDCDLTDALRFHREKKAMATLVLKRVGVPLSYGVVMTDGENRVTRFIEKPTWSRVFSDLVNTGTYILEPEVLSHIPDSGTPDFGKDIFPALLASGLPVYGYETKGYWCDVGDLRMYLQAQFDLLDGRVDLPCEKGIQPGASVHARAAVQGECLIASGAEIGSGATVIHSVIGKNCVIAPGAVVENACLWDGAEVRAKARVSGSVLCDGVTVGQGTEIADGCALGKRAVTGAFTLLRPGSRIWPHIKTAPGSVIARSVSMGDWNAPQWAMRGAACETPEEACDLCGAFAKTAKVRRVITGSGAAPALEAVVSGALAAAGVDVYSVGETTAPMLRTLIRALDMDGGIYALDRTLMFFQRNGEALSSKARSAMDGCVVRQDLPPAFVKSGTVAAFSGAETVYLSAIVPKGSSRSLFSPIAVFSDSRRILTLAKEGLKRINARDARFAAAAEAQVKPEETGFLISEGGEDATVFTSRGSLKPEETTMLLLWLCHQKTGRLFDMAGVPRAAAQIAALKQTDEGESCALQRTVLTDGLAAMLLIAEGLKQGSLEELKRRVPATAIKSLDVPCETRDKGRILHTLCDEITLPYTMDEGIRVSHDGGFATIVPDGMLGMVHVISEAQNSEFAQELCDFYGRRIQNIAKGAAQNVFSP